MCALVQEVAAVAEFFCALEMSAQYAQSARMEKEAPLSALGSRQFPVGQVTLRLEEELAGGSTRPLRAAI